MKPKGLLIAVVLLAVVGGLVWWSNKSQADKAKAPAADAPAKLLTIADDQFVEIRIKKVTDELLALKRENGKWLVTAPKPMAADQDAAGSMVSTLANLNADKAVEEKATDRLADLATCNGISSDDRMLRFDGRPFTPEDLLENVRGVI